MGYFVQQVHWIRSKYKAWKDYLITTSSQPPFCAKEGRQKCQSCPWQNLISFKHFSLILILQFLGGEFQNQRNHATSFKLILRVEKCVNEYVNLFFFEFCVLCTFYSLQIQFMSWELTRYELRVFRILFVFITNNEYQNGNY